MFSSNSKTRDWALGKKHPTPKDFVNEFGALKPCIHGSDAHCFEKLCRPDKDRFCWIKADPSFEGLKQITYEPEERVIIQPENPEHRKSIYTLDSIKIKNSRINDELSIEEQFIPLNKNLIGVTGGKGSGKTALLDLIANCFEDRCKRGNKNKEDKNSFVQRIEDDKQDLEIEIGFIGEDLGKFSKKLTEEKFFQNSRITYLPQGKIEEYSGDREKLNKKIEEVIFDNKHIMEKGYKQHFDKLRDEIAGLVNEVRNINMDIYELEEETEKGIITDIKNQKLIEEGDLKNKEDEHRELTESMEEEIKERIGKLKKQEMQLRAKRSGFQGIMAKLEEFKSDLEEPLDGFGRTMEIIDDLNREFAGLALDLVIPQLDFKPQLDIVREALKLLPKEISEITKEIEKKESMLKQLSGAEKAHADLLKEINNIKVNIKSLANQLKELSSRKKEMKSLETERITRFHELLTKYWGLKHYYDEVIKIFSEGKSEIMGGIGFRSTVYFDMESFVELGSDILDLRRKINVDDIEADAKELGTVIKEHNSEKFLEKLEQFFQRISKRKELLKQTRTNGDFYEWIFGDYFSLSTEIFFNGIPMDKLSMGQKGTVLLKLFLAEGDYPLIIDQPEENLDNKFIYAELVGAFRKAKKERQIIIATNNANLIVNTDAEQIIVAEFEDNKISYKLGSLENLETRKDIIPILEGSKKAFRERERKYGIQISAGRDEE